MRINFACISVSVPTPVDGNVFISCTVGNVREYVGYCECEWRHTVATLNLTISANLLVDMNYPLFCVYTHCLYLAYSQGIAALFHSSWNLPHIELLYSWIIACSPLLHLDLSYVLECTATCSAQRCLRAVMLRIVRTSVIVFFAWPNARILA